MNNNILAELINKLNIDISTPSYKTLTKLSGEEIEAVAELVNKIMVSAVKSVVQNILIQSLFDMITALPKAQTLEKLFSIAVIELKGFACKNIIAFKVSDKLNTKIELVKTNLIYKWKKNKLPMSFKLNPLKTKKEYLEISRKTISNRRLFSILKANNITRIYSIKNEKFKTIIGYILLSEPDGKQGGLEVAYQELFIQICISFIYLCAQNMIISQQATVDELTGGYIKSYFLTSIAPQIMKLIKESEENNYYIIMCDIDHFKRINDTYGHLKGDEVLKKVGNILYNSIRTSDYLCRYGGEEFCILLEGIKNNEDAFAVGEKIRYRISENIKIKSKPVTISSGITKILKKDTDIKEAIKRADKNLYIAKRLGRNRVII